MSKKAVPVKHDFRKPTPGSADEKRAELTAVIRGLMIAHGIDYPADHATECGLSSLAGYITFDGLVWPVWNNSNTRNITPVWVSTLTGKLEGVPGISTACTANKLCAARRNNPDCICSNCFAVSTLERYTAAGEHMTLNALLLAYHVLPADLAPVLGNVRIARIEAFGDLANVIQAHNYLTIINANPAVFFGWWTKNPGFIDVALKTAGRPGNVSFILSSFFKNKEAAARFSWIDHTFTVYTPEHVKAAGVVITCGARDCVGCCRCYKRGNGAPVREQLK